MNLPMFINFGVFKKTPKLMIIGRFILIFIDLQYHKRVPAEFGTPVGETKAVLHEDVNRRSYCSIMSFSPYFTVLSHQSG